MSKAGRRAALSRGRAAELWAAWFLRAKGYRILGRDLDLGVGEIDLLARRGDILAIVEVKRRRTRLAALESISPRQRRRIARAAELLLAQRRDWGSLMIRFDVMLVSPWRWPQHLPDAWRP